MVCCVLRVACCACAVGVLNSQVYERAIAQKPLSVEKRSWRRYVYLWIYYAGTPPPSLPRSLALWPGTSSTGSCSTVPPPALLPLARRSLSLPDFLVWLTHTHTHTRARARALSLIQIHTQTVFEELAMKDLERARAVYKEALKLVPHAHFSFAKLWIMAAHLEIRAKDVAAARKVCRR